MKKRLTILCLAASMVLVLSGVSFAGSMVSTDYDEFYHWTATNNDINSANPDTSDAVHIYLGVENLGTVLNPNWKYTYQFELDNYDPSGDGGWGYVKQFRLPVTGTLGTEFQFGVEPDGLNHVPVTAAMGAPGATTNYLDVTFENVLNWIDPSGISIRFQNFFHWSFLDNRVK